MKFISWLFNFTSRHYTDVRRYERSGKLYRLFICILLTALGALTLWLEDWSFSMFDKTHLELFVGGIFAILLFFCVWIGTLELYVLYAYLGISRAIAGSLQKVIDKCEKKRARKQRAVTSGSNSEENSSAEAEISAASAKRKVPAWLDALVGIFSILAFIALTALVIRYPFHGA